MTTERWIVATEFDEGAFKKLGDALRQAGFVLDREWNAVAGSQDIAFWEVVSPQGKLAIESETYIGLSVNGDAALVCEVKNKYESLKK